MIDLSAALPYLAPSSSGEDTAPFHAYGTLDAPITRAFSKSVQVHYIVDEPGALVYIRERDVSAELRDDLHLCALDNLRRRAELRKPRFESRGATQRAKWCGTHDASLLLLDELWDHRGAHLVAAVPARNTLLFGESPDLASILAELRGQMAKTSLSAELFTRRGKQWHPV